MKRIACSVLLAAAAVGLASAQPSINNNGVLNAASYALPGLPNSAIAQGSIFVIFGTNMGPASLVQAPSLPLSTTLSGTSVQVTVNGTTVNCPILYTSALQVAAIMPSTTPVGTGTIVVTYNGTPSVSRSVQVTSNSFGIFTVNAQGTGTGIITNANYQVFSPSAPATPGQAAIIWGTGLGPVSYSDAGPSQVQDMTNVPVQVYVGGKTAMVFYRGRSGYAGEDQINFFVPQDVTPGCNVSVAVRINNVVSNIATMPVAGSANTVCSDNNAIPASDLQTLLGKGSFSIGTVVLGRTAINVTAPVIGSVKFTTDVGSATFEKYTPATFNASANAQFTTLNSCTILTSTGTSTPTPPVFNGLDAGPAINVKGPNGTKQLTAASKGDYSGTLSSGNPLGGMQTLFLDPGTYTIDNGAGGADVKSFNFNMTLSTPFTWNELNTAGNSPIVRSQGYTVTWSGGAPGTYAVVAGVSSSSGTPAATAVFTCIAPVEAGKLVIGPDVLLSLPASAAAQGGVPTSFLTVGNESAPVKFTAPGLDYGVALSLTSNGAGVTFQ